MAEISQKKLKTDDLMVSLPRKEHRYLLTEALLDEVMKGPTEVQRKFEDLLQKGDHPKKEDAQYLTEKIFELAGFQLLRTKTEVVVFNKCMGEYEVSIQYWVDKKFDQTVLSCTIYQQNSQLDFNISFFKDISAVLNHFNSSQLPYLSIEFIQKMNTVQVQTSLIELLESNYTSWLVLNIDAILIAHIDLVVAFQQIKQNQTVESSLLIQKCLEGIKSKINQIRSSYEQLLVNIKYFKTIGFEN